jgi:diguanylate cyclase (GGDEF)-like protein
MSQPDPGKRRRPVAAELDAIWGPATYTAASLGPFAHPMARARMLLYFSSSGARPAAGIREFALRMQLTIVEETTIAGVVERVRRIHPAAVVIDGSPPVNDGIELCARLKREAFTAIIPVIVHAGSGGGELVATALEAGADEVLGPGISNREIDLRMALALRRAHRDVSVHPTTLLPGTVQIELDFAARIASGESFAVCYADLDHFKEYNDRYGYHCGDRVILVLSRIIRDIVFGTARDAFVGHIGGDDFIFCLPLEYMKPCCEQILEAFDALIPIHYDAADRARGHFIGKDRRGNEYEVPLMTLSIGVVTNEHRELNHPARIGELATEMKTYAKSIPGSNYAVDRRVDRVRIEV